MNNPKQISPWPWYLFLILHIIFAFALALFVLTPNAEPGDNIKTMYVPVLTGKCYETYHLNGLIETGYDRDADNKADWITLSRMGRDQLPMKYALFYALDVDGDGLWEMVWRDLEEDGWNGNETVYESAKNILTTDEHR